MDVERRPARRAQDEGRLKGDPAVKFLVVLSSLIPLFVTLWIALNKQQIAERENAILRTKLAKCTCPAEGQP